MSDGINGQQTRIIVANKGRLLREILKRAIEKSPHMRVVGEVTDGKSLLSMVERGDVEWVVLSLSPDGEIPAMAETVLSRNPSVAVLAVAPDGSELRVGWTEPQEKNIAVAPGGSLVELRWTQPHDELLENLSFEKLLELLHKGALWKLVERASED